MKLAGSTRQVVTTVLLVCLISLIGLLALLSVQYQGALAPAAGLSTPLPRTPAPHGPAVLTQSALAVIARATASPAPTFTAAALVASPTQPVLAATPVATLLPGMVRVPAGSFLMGAATGDRLEQPEHPVLLDAFLIDIYEVTNAAYRACTTAGACTPTVRQASASRPDYYDNPAFDTYPVIGVDWAQASAYCQWAGKRLPTEAEWEYAASGPDNYQWPWGNTFLPERATVAEADTLPVESYPLGASPFGVMNMAGNVAEWVADAYVENYYAAAPAHNPLGVAEGALRLYRGGSFGQTDARLYTTSRRFIKPAAFADVAIGFRCAFSPPATDSTASALSLPELVAHFCRAYVAYRAESPCP